MLLGGRNLGGPSEPAVRLVAGLDDRPVASFDVQPGFFMRFITLPDGALAGDGRFAKLTVRAEPVAAQATPRVGLEQFSLQASDVVQFGFGDGWFEPEYNPQTARSWRWMSDAAVLQVHDAGRGVTIEISGESPMRYYDSPPLLRVSAGGRIISEARPTEDFALHITIPAAVLAAAQGRVLLQSSDYFIPGDREATADRRHLALRIYSVQVKEQAP
jgi:hypothetical protein